MPSQFDKLKREIAGSTKYTYDQKIVLFEEIGKREKQLGRINQIGESISSLQELDIDTKDAQDMAQQEMLGTYRRAVRGDERPEDTPQFDDSYMGKPYSEFPEGVRKVLGALPYLTPQQREEMLFKMKPYFHQMAGNLIKGPQEMMRGIYNLGAGAVKEWTQRPKQAAQALVDPDNYKALANSVGSWYGEYFTHPLKKLRDDPFFVAADVMGAVGAVGKGANLVGKAAKGLNMAKTAKVASKISDLTNKVRLGAKKIDPAYATEKLAAKTVRGQLGSIKSKNLELREKWISKLGEVTHGMDKAQIGRLREAMEGLVPWSKLSTKEQVAVRAISTIYDEIAETSKDLAVFGKKTAKTIKDIRTKPLMDLLKQRGVSKRKTVVNKMLKNRKRKGIPEPTYYPRGEEISKSDFFMSEPGRVPRYQSSRKRTGKKAEFFADPVENMKHFYAQRAKVFHALEVKNKIKEMGEKLNKRNPLKEGYLPVKVGSGKVQMPEKIAKTIYKIKELPERMHLPIVDDLVNFWKYNVLSMRPAWMVNNAAGNSLYATLHGTGPVSLGKAALGKGKELNVGSGFTQSMFGSQGFSNTAGIGQASRNAMKFAGDAVKNPSKVVDLVKNIAKTPKKQLLYKASDMTKTAAKALPKMVNSLNEKMEEVFRRAVGYKEGMNLAKKQVIKETGKSLWLNHRKFKQLTEQAYNTIASNPTTRKEILNTVNDVMNDYTKISKIAPVIEHEVIRRLFPFHKFFRHAIRKLYTLPLKQPEKVMVMREMSKHGMKYNEDIWREYLKPPDMNEKDAEKIYNHKNMPEDLRDAIPLFETETDMTYPGGKKGKRPVIVALSMRGLNPLRGMADVGWGAVTPIASFIAQEYSKSTRIDDTVLREIGPEGEYEIDTTTNSMRKSGGGMGVANRAVKTLIPISRKAEDIMYPYRKYVTSSLWSPHIKGKMADKQPVINKSRIVPILSWLGVSLREIDTPTTRLYIIKQNRERPKQALKNLRTMATEPSFGNYTNIPKMIKHLETIGRKDGTK